MAAKIDAWRTLLTVANKEGLIDVIKDKVDISPESVVANYPQAQWSDYLGELGISLLHRGSILEELRKLAANNAPSQAPQPGPSSVWLDASREFLKTVDFYSMEENGEDLSLFGREPQVAALTRIFETFWAHDKMQVAVISSSRGMGKTFFCKKMCLSDKEPFKQAREIGRIIPVECDNANVLLEDKLYDLFWSRLVVSHMTNLFNGIWINHTQFGTFQFRRLGLSEVAKSSRLGNSNFDCWAKHFAGEKLATTGMELINLTNRFFGIDEQTTRPIFVLDNAHQFAERQLTIPSHNNEFHTILSWLLTVLASWRCFCLVAGTTDKNLQKMTDFSNFLVCHIHLTGIRRRYWNDIGCELITKLNQKYGTNVIWKHLDVSNTKDFGHEDENENVDVDAVDDEDEDKDEDVVGTAVVGTAVVDGDVVHADAMDVSTNTQQVDPLFAKDDNSALLGMIYHGAGVARFIRLAVKAWYEGKVKGLTLMAITEEFAASVRIYYSDACQKILAFNPSDFAELLMACSVNYFPYDGDYLLPGKFCFRDLVNQAVIFPYRAKKVEGTGTYKCSFTIPSALFASANNRKRDAVANHWESVTEELNRRVPNLLWKHLFPSFSSWWNASLNLRDLGNIWENVLAAAIAVCYYLHVQCNPTTGPWYKFSKIYKLPSTARGKKVLKSFQVNLSSGIVQPEQEATPSTSLANAINVNSKIHNAHLDMVMHSRPVVAAIQSKNTANKPVTAAIVQQARGEHILLWVYPGCAEDCGELPKKFKNIEVNEKLGANKLAFLSGAGCVSALNMDFILLMKGLAEGVHASVKKSN